MTRLLLSAWAAAMLLVATATEAQGAHVQPHSGAKVRARHGLTLQTAADVRASRDPARLATMLAERYWGAVPCGGQIAVRADQPLAAGLQSTTDGWATFESSLGPNDLQAPASTYTQCVISLAHWQWPTRLQEAGDWNMLCLTVVHEMGHLLGHPHSLTPGSVMAEVFTDEASVPAACREARAQVEVSAGLTGVR